MSLLESARPVVEAGARRRRRRLSRLQAALLVVVLLVAATGWWVLSTPQLEGGGLAGVSSPDHEVVSARGLHESVYVVSAQSDGESTLALGLHNGGRLPVQLVDVWPSRDDPLCSWQPSRRLFQDDPRYMSVLDEHARPAAGATLRPGASATLWLTGAHQDPGRCQHAAINLHEDVEVVVRIAGRTSTTRIPLGYTFGYTDDPQSLRGHDDYRVLPPTRSAADG